MDKISDQTILEILKADIGMALGCTEPIAAALAVVKAREVLGVTPERIQLKVSGNIYKNGMGVGIPGTDRRGIKIAAALGALTGSSDRALEVLEGVTEDISQRAVSMVEQGKVEICIEDGVDRLFIRAIVFFGDQNAEAIVEKKHTNISSATLNGEEVFRCCEKEKSYTQSCTGRIDGLTVERLYEFAKSVDLKELDCLARGAEANWNISQAGLKSKFGYRLGRTLNLKSASDSDHMRSAMAKVAAGIDARMSGSILPVMTNSGSGNQGITIYVPVIDCALRMQASTEELLRALAFANIVPIHIKKQIGSLSALCGIVPASIGAACGIAFLKGATLKQIENIIQLVIANISGLFCDGAKASCSLKASTGISAAFMALYIALDSNMCALDDGILDISVEQSIDNLSKIAASGMVLTDEQIINIMSCK